MSEYIIGGVELRRFGGSSHPPDEAHYEILKRTIGLVPPEHLTGLNRVEARRPRQPPTRGGGHNPHQKVIRLSAASFSESHNRVVNQTFLHEMGHIVDFNFRCLAQIRSFSTNAGHPLRADAAALLSTPIHSSRRTHGPGEIIADCYQILFRSLRISRPYRNRAITTHYTGREAQRRFRVLLATTAFQNVSLRQLREDNNDQGFNNLIEDLAQ